MALEIFQKTIKLVDQRFHVQWPLKMENLNLPANFGLSFGRLKTNIQRLKNINKLKKYFKNKTKQT